MFSSALCCSRLSRSRLRPQRVGAGVGHGVGLICKNSGNVVHITVGTAVLVKHGRPAEMCNSIVSYSGTHHGTNIFCN